LKKSYTILIILGASRTFQRKQSLFPKQILDNNMLENDETEEYSVENYPTDYVKDVRILKSRYSQSGWYEEIYNLIYLLT
jgi:hypothetical protein